MSKHTHGPWISTFEDMGGYDCMTDAFYIKQDTEEKIRPLIATLDLSDYGQKHCIVPSAEIKEQAGANARLIAKAPDMYDTIKALSIRLEELYKFYGYDDGENALILPRAFKLLEDIDA